MSLTKYSVIIPAYNAESTLRQTIVSVINQTVPPDNVIVVNDASQDRTLQISEEFNIKIINNTRNLGTGNSRNRALQLIEDGIVAIIDSDDTWDTDYAEKMMKLWQVAPSGTGAIGMLLRPIGDLEKSGYLRQNFRMQKKGFSSITGMALAWHNPFYASATSFDAKVLKEIGGWGQNPSKFCEDYSLLAAIFNRGYNLYLYPVESGNYTVSLNQKSANIQLHLTAQIAIIESIFNSSRLKEYRFLRFRVAGIKFAAWCKSISQLLIYKQTDIPKITILGERRYLVLIDSIISSSLATKLLLNLFKIIRRIVHLL